MRLMKKVIARNELLTIGHVCVKYITCCGAKGVIKKIQTQEHFLLCVTVKSPPILMLAIQINFCAF